MQRLQISGHIPSKIDSLLKIRLPQDLKMNIQL